MAIWTFKSIRKMPLARPADGKISQLFRDYLVKFTEEAQMRGLDAHIYPRPYKHVVDIHLYKDGIELTDPADYMVMAGYWMSLDPENGWLETEHKRFYYKSEYGL